MLKSVLEILATTPAKLKREICHLLPAGDAGQACP